MASQLTTQKRQWMPAPLSIDLRKRIMNLVDQGLSHDEVAERLVVSQSAVSSLVRHYNTYGHIYPFSPTGNTPTFDEGDYGVIKEIVEKNPDLTLSKYAELISKRTKKSVMSDSTICRLLQKLNLRRKKKSKYAGERDREDVKKKT